MFQDERILGSIDRYNTKRQCLPLGRYVSVYCSHTIQSFTTTACRQTMPLRGSEVFFMEKDKKVLRLVLLAMLVGLGVVISPILRIEGMCPMAHLINITCAVLMGPWYALLCATLIGIIRMTMMGIPPLALTGAVFGATLSGLLYRASHGRLIAAVIGEVIGTGIIGAIVSYPVMEIFYGRTGLSWMYYVPMFISGTLIGGSIAFCLLMALSRNGTLREFQQKLGVNVYDNRRKK